jgi:hypothetical protein
MPDLGRSGNRWRCIQQQTIYVIMWPLSALADWPSSLRDCSESPVPALNVKMCMVQHLLLSALGVGCRSRPKADLQPFSAMLRCGPSERTFAARAKFDDGRTHSLRTKCEFAATARMAAVGQLLYDCPRFDRDLTTGQMVFFAIPLSKADFRDTPDHLQIALDVAFVLTYES